MIRHNIAHPIVDTFRPDGSVPNFLDFCHFNYSAQLATEKLFPFRISKYEEKSLPISRKGQTTDAPMALLCNATKLFSGNYDLI